MANPSLPGPGPSGGRVAARRSPTDPNRLFLDFDPAAPGGRGGASIRLVPSLGLASVDGVYKNANLPPRSTGDLLAEGLRQAGMPRPAILEAFNVKRSTAATLDSGGTCSGTRVGLLLGDTATALGGSVARWEPIREGGIWHIRAHVSYP